MNKKKVITGVGIVLFMLVLSHNVHCALSCDVWVNRGCGSTYEIGDSITIYFKTNAEAYVKLRLTYPDGSSRVLAEGTVCGGVTYYTTGEIGEPAGKRILFLEAWSGNQYDTDMCTYYGSNPPGSIKVESSPSGADCYLDGTHKGKTPLTIKNLPEGKYTVKVKKSGYESWTKTVAIHSNETTYVYATLQKESGSIKVTSDPSGATCYLDGNRKGDTPLTINYVSEGYHTITLRKDGYYEWEDTVSVYAGERSYVEAILRIKIGSLSVDGNVDGAAVYINGVHRGTTPLEIDIPVGNYTVQISAEGYYDHTENVTVEADETHYVTAVLEEKPGFIEVKSSPSGAEVYLDEELQGITPITIPYVQPGTYTLTLGYSGYNDWTTHVTVNPDETVTVRASMQKVFWKAWYFAAGIVLAVCALAAVGFLPRRKQPVVSLESVEPPTKLKSAFESAAKIARAPFVPIEMLINIVLADKENRCPICHRSLDNGGIIECIHCKDEGFTCKFHENCWEEHKMQQQENKQKGIRCYKYPDIYISEESINHLSQVSVSS